MMALRQKLDLFKRNRDLKNVFFGLLSYFITPFVLLISTPLLLKHLGSADYGIWILINSVVAFMTFSNFGLGNAMIKLGSELRSDSENDNEEFNQIFNVTFTLSILFAATIMVIIMICGSPLLSLFTKSHLSRNTTSISYLLGGITSLKIVNSVVSATIMAKHRYDLNSKINIVINMLSMTIYTVLAVFTEQLSWLIWALLFSSLMLLGTSIYAARKVIPDLRFAFDFNKSIARKVMSFGMYTWTQAINSTLQSQLDKLIIGSLLGPAVLGYYSVCMTLAFKIHEIPVAAGGYLLAKFSSLHESNDNQKIERIFRYALIAKSIFIIFSTLLIIIFAKSILSFWINENFAEQHYELLRLLSTGVAVGAFIVIPYYYMNGTGAVRVNSVIAFLITVVTMGTLYLLIPTLGVYSAGIGKLACTPLILFTLYFVERRIKRDRQMVMQRQLEAIN